MFQSIKNAFKTKEIRDKILFTLAMVAVIRLGTGLVQQLSRRRGRYAPRPDGPLYRRIL